MFSEFFTFEIIGSPISWDYADWGWILRLVWAVRIRAPIPTVWAIPSKSAPGPPAAASRPHHRDCTGKFYMSFFNFSFFLAVFCFQRFQLFLLSLFCFCFQRFQCWQKNLDFDKNIHEKSTLIKNTLYSAAPKITPNFFLKKVLE